MPEIPASWSQAIAAVGAIVVLILFMRFMTELMGGQGKQSATLIDRAFDIADATLAKMAPEATAELRSESVSGPQAPAASDPSPLPPDDTPPSE